MCTAACKCVDCRNFEGSTDLAQIAQLGSARRASTSNGACASASSAGAAAGRQSPSPAAMAAGGQHWQPAGKRPRLGGEHGDGSPPMHVAAASELLYEMTGAAGNAHGAAMLADGEDGRLGAAGAAGAHGAVLASGPSLLAGCITQHRLLVACEAMLRAALAAAAAVPPPAAADSARAPQPTAAAQGLALAQLTTLATAADALDAVPSSPSLLCAEEPLDPNGDGGWAERAPEGAPRAGAAAEAEPLPARSAETTAFEFERYAAQVGRWRSARKISHAVRRGPAVCLSRIGSLSVSSEHSAERATPPPPSPFLPRRPLPLRRSQERALLAELNSALRTLATQATRKLSAQQQFGPALHTLAAASGALSLPPQPPATTAAAGAGGAAGGAKGGGVIRVAPSPGSRMPASPGPRAAASPAVRAAASPGPGRGEQGGERATPAPAPSPHRPDVAAAIAALAPPAAPPAAAGTDAARAGQPQPPIPSSTPAQCAPTAPPAHACASASSGPPAAAQLAPARAEPAAAGSIGSLEQAGPPQPSGPTALPQHEQPQHSAQLLAPP